MAITHTHSTSDIRVSEMMLSQHECQSRVEITTKIQFLLPLFHRVTHRSALRFNGGEHPAKLRCAV